MIAARQMNPEMMQMMGRIKPQAFQPPPTNPILGRLKPQIDQTTVAEEPQPTIYTTPVAEQESQVYTTPQADEDPTRGRLITPPHDFEGERQADKDAEARANAERDRQNLEDAKPLNMYIGPNAKGYDDLDPNLHPEFSSIADRMRRKEISDEGADIIAPYSEKHRMYAGVSTLGDLLDHPQLYKQYPELKNTRIAQHDASSVNDGLKGGYSEATGEEPEKIILVPENITDYKSTTLHEIQHAIQGREGFAQGGMAGQFMDQKQEAKELNDYLKSVEEILTTGRRLEDGSIRKGGVIYQEPDVLKQIDELKSRVNELGGKKLLTPQEQYNNLAGEVEARDTQARMNLSMADRLKKEPLSSQGVRPQDMIVRRLKGGVANSEGALVPQPPTNKNLGKSLIEQDKSVITDSGLTQFGKTLDRQKLLDLAKQLYPNDTEYHQQISDLLDKPASDRYSKVMSYTVNDDEQKQLPQDIVASRLKGGVSNSEGDGVEPPIKDGYTRLYRGESKSGKPFGKWFTSNREVAEFFKEESGNYKKNKSRLVYVDLPADEAEQYYVSGDTEHGYVPNDEEAHILPEHIIAKKSIIKEK
jgi:hypothetical protein